MNYQEALKYIHSTGFQGTKLGLSRIRELLGKIGNPEKKLRYVHVAGTNGKGSTCAMLASVFQAAGYRTGLYTSPFINRFNERMQIDGMPIPDDELALVTDSIKNHIDAMEEKPTGFETITAIAFKWFAEKQCDIVILEVGMGGEFDATNVIEHPELSVIVAMGMDHIKELGPTMRDIAHAKAGIIKEGRPVISYGGVPEADAEIARVAGEKHAPLTLVDHSIIEPGNVTLHSQTFSYGKRRYLEIPLIGKYQMNNAATALTAVDKLIDEGWKISEDDIRNGLKNVWWPARFEILSESPVFIVDGGHNAHGIRATADSIARLFPNRKLTFVMGMLRDKDVSDAVSIVIPYADRFFTAKPDSSRAMEATEIADLIVSLGGKAFPCESIDSAVSRAIEYAGPDGVVVSVGSLYMSGAVRAYFHPELKCKENELACH